jgi:hypothetical protein
MTLRRIWEDNIKTDLREIILESSLDWTGSGYGTVAVYCTHGNEFSGYIKHEELLLKLGRYQLLKKNSAVWSLE